MIKRTTMKNEVLRFFISEGYENLPKEVFYDKMTIKSHEIKERGACDVYYYCK